MTLPLPVGGKGSRRLCWPQPSGGAADGPLCGQSGLVLLREKRRRCAARPALQP